jgi:hypothetical protein
MAYEGNEIEGWMLNEELQWLYETASKFIRVVEIGSWKGRSTHALLSGCKGTVYAVDHFKGSLSQINGVHHEALMTDIHEIFKKNVGHFPNLVILKMDSIKASKLFKDGYFDMIFIDAGHESYEVEPDIEVWYPKCKTLFCGHDLYEGGVKAALTNAGLNFEPAIGSIWMVRL